MECARVQEAARPRKTGKGMSMMNVQELKAKVSANPKDSESWFALGKEYFDTDFKEAHRCFSMALAQEPFNAEYRLNRGRKSLSLDSFEEALADLTLAVRLDVECGEKWHYLGNAYFYLGRYQEAIDSYKSAIDCYRRNGGDLEAPAIDWIWMAYMLDGRPQEAKAYVEANTTPDMPVPDSDLSYKKRILLYAGYTDIDTFLNEVVNYDDDLDAITELYGAVNYYKFIAPDREKAVMYLDKLLSYEQYHHAFAYKLALKDRAAFEREAE